MPVLEPVVATLTVNTAEFTAGLTEAKAQMAEFGAGADLTGTEGDLAGLGVAGKQAGEDVKVGAEDAVGGLGGLKTASEDAKGGLEDAKGAAKDAGSAAEESGGKFGLLSNIFGNLPGPLGEASSKTKEFKGSIDDAGESSGGFASVLGDIPVPAVIAGAAIAGVAAVSVELASKYQTVTNQIAASEGITTGAATRIGQAFLTTAGTTTMSAQQIATAFAGVAGQAKQINGSALSAGQSLGLMKSAIDLAEASGTSLTSATSALTTTLQAFGLGISSSPLVSNVLYSAANATGQSVTSLGAALDKVKTKLGGMAPPIQQLGGLLVDLTSHGETGRAAMSALTTTFTNFLKPAAAVATAQNNLKVATDALPPSLKALAAQVQSGAISSEGATMAAEGLGASQAALFSTFTSANSAMATASEAAGKLGISTVTATGQMKPMSDIIAQLHDKIQGMGTAQATAELTSLGFGNASAKLVATIQAGPAAYDKYVAEVEKTNAAHAAAEKATSGMDASFEKAKAAIEDAGIALGEKLMPAVTAVAQGVAKFVAGFVKDWPEISKAVSTGFDVIKPALELFMKLLGDVVSFIVDHKPILIAAIAAIAVAFFPVTASALAFALAASEIIKHWSGVKDFFVDIWHGIETALAPVIDYVKIALDMLATVFKVEFDAYAAVVKIAFDVIKGIVTAAWDVIKGIFEVAIDLLTGDWTGAWNAMRNTVHAVLSDISGTISGVVGTFVGFFNQAWNAIKSGFTAAFNVVKGILDGFLSPVTSIIGSIVGFFTALPGEVANALGDFFTVAFAALTKVLGWINTNVWTPVSGFFTALPSKVASLLGDFFTVAWTALTKALDWLNSNVWAPVNTFFGGLPGKVAGAIGSFFSTAFSAMLSAGSWVNTNVVQPIISTITGMPGTIAGDLSGFIASIFSGIGNVASWVDTNIVQPVVNEIKSIPGKIGSIGGQILDDITGGLGSLASHVPGLASGGYVTQPTLAMIGENGPEFVIPQSALSAGGVSALPNITPIAGGSTGGAGGGISAQIVNQPINLVVNGQTLASLVTQFQLRSARSTGNVAGQWAGGNQGGTATSINTNAVPR